MVSIKCIQENFISLSIMHSCELVYMCGNSIYFKLPYGIFKVVELRTDFVVVQSPNMTIKHQLFELASRNKQTWTMHSILDTAMYPLRLLLFSVSFVFHSLQFQWIFINLNCTHFLVIVVILHYCIYSYLIIKPVDVYPSIRYLRTLIIRNTLIPKWKSNTLILNEKATQQRHHGNRDKISFARRKRQFDMENMEFINKLLQFSVFTYRWILNEHFSPVTIWKSQ